MDNVKHFDSTGDKVSNLGDYYVDLYHFARLIKTSINDSEIQNDAQNIMDAITNAVIANFTYTPENPVVNQTITFNASNSSDPDGFIVKYVWNFGDSSAGEGKVVTPSYSSPADYIVTLNVIDDEGAKNTTSREVKVKEEAKPRVSIYKQTFTIPLKVGEYGLGFNASWFVTLYNTTTYEVLAEDTADWRFVSESGKTGRWKERQKHQKCDPITRFFISLSCLTSFLLIQ